MRQAAKGWYYVAKFTNWTTVIETGVLFLLWSGRFQ